MTPEQQIVKLTTTATQAIKVTRDWFGSTETKVPRAVHKLKASVASVSYTELFRGNRAAARQPVAAACGSASWDKSASATKKENQR